MKYPHRARRLAAGIERLCAAIDEACRLRGAGARRRLRILEARRRRLTQDLVALEIERLAATWR